jgi:hypothetical protein
MFIKSQKNIITLFGTFIIFFFYNNLYSFPKDSTLTIPQIKQNKIVFNFDSRNTSIRKESVTLYGFRIGFQHKINWRLGIGFYHNLSSLEINNVNNKSVDGQKVDVNLLFGYIAPFIEYILLNHKRWEISIPFETGIGGTSANIFDLNRNNFIKNTHKIVFPIETALTGHYKIFPWIGIGYGIGYRQVLSKESITRESLSSGFYIIKIKIFPEPILKKFKK